MPPKIYRKNGNSSTEQHHEFEKYWRQVVETESLADSLLDTEEERNARRSSRMERYWIERNAWWEGENPARFASAKNLVARNNNLDSICSVYAKADRILTNLSVNVHLNDNPDMKSPAWNDGKDVTFNASIVKDIDNDTVISLHGLNYHELAHLMFTPRRGSVLGQYVTETITRGGEVKIWTRPDGQEVTYNAPTYEEPKNPKRAMVFNILEDLRAERLLTTKYPTTIPFLTSTVGTYLLESPEGLCENFILVGARFYLDDYVRQSSYEMYAKKYGKEQADRVYALTKEYTTLVFPRDYARASEIIEALTEIMPEGLETPNGCSGRAVMKSGKPVGEKEQSKINAEFAEPEELDTEGDPATGAGGEATEDSTDHDTHFVDKSEELVEQIQKAVERAKASKEVASKARDTIRAITRANSVKPTLTERSGAIVEPTSQEVAASRMFATELERLRIECDPAWEQELPTGKLNVRRAMNADVNEINRLFDRWETGNDDYDIEACLMIDKSGSMYRDIGGACRSAWVIKRALERINGKVTVMTFSDDGNILYQSNEKAKPTAVKIVGSGGGTDPLSCLAETERIMTNSTAKTKLAIILTDGQFNNESPDKTIKYLSQNGVHTSIVYLDAYNRKTESELAEKLQHGADNFRAIAKITDLVKVARDIVKYQVSRGARV